MRTKEEKIRNCAKWALISLIIFSTFLLAPYLKYQDADAARKTAETKLADRSPKLHGFIDQDMIGDEPGTSNSVILLQVSVGNSGGSSSIAEDYKLEVFLTNGLSKDAKPMDIPDEYTLNLFRSNTLTILKLPRSELISEKTSKRIESGDEPRGWLAFKLLGVPINQYREEESNIVLSFWDINQHEIFVTNGFFEGKRLTNESENLPRTLPGSINLIETNIQLPTEIDFAHWEPPELPAECTNVSVIFGNQVFSIPIWAAEASPEGIGTKFSIPNIPEQFVSNLDKLPNYSPRFTNLWVRSRSFWGKFGDKVIDYPFQPFVVSNHFYLYIQIPFLSGRQKLLMNYKFDSALPNSWDRNFGTNRYAYEIVNENGNPVLQVLYTKPNEILLNGIFLVGTNDFFEAFWSTPQLAALNYKTVDLVTKQEITNMPLNTLLVSNGKTNLFGEIMTNAIYDLTFTNQRAIFQYPSNRKLGVFANR